MLLIARLFRAEATPEITEARSPGWHLSPRKRERGGRPRLPGSDKHHIPLTLQTLTGLHGRASLLRLLQTWRGPHFPQTLCWAVVPGSFPTQLKGISGNCSRIVPVGHHHPQPPATLQF